MTDGSRDEGRQARGLALAYPERRERVKQHRSKGGWYASKRALCRRFGRKEAQGARKAYGLVALVVLFFALVYPARGYAIDNNIVIYGPTAYVWQDSTYYEIGVVADNKYDAALVALGYDPSNNDMFTAEVKAKLSNESTALGFYNFAQRFENPPTDGGTLTQTGIQPGFWATSYAIYGAGRIWHAQYESADRLAAKLYVEFVLQGGTGNPEGGGSGGGSGDGLGELTNELVTNASLNMKSGGEQCNLTPDGSKIVTSQSYVKSWYNANKTGKNNVIPICWNGYVSYNWTSDWSGILLTENTPTVIKTDTQNDGAHCIELRGCGSWAWLTGFNTQFVPASWGTVASKTGIIGTGIADNRRTYSGSGTFKLSKDGISSSYVSCMAYNLNALLPPIPDTNWPEPDDPLPEPEPPEVPDVPDEQPITQPNPTDPTVPQQPTDVVGGTPPQYDPVTYPTEQTHTADLQGVLDAMAEHCRHLQAAIHTMGDDLGSYLGTIVTQQVTRLHDMVYDNFAWLGGLITGEGSATRTTIHSDIGWLGTRLTDEFDALKTYLNDLFTWLGEQLNFTVDIQNDSYDDSSVLYWLKRIWSKMGDGISTRPVDPVVDPIGIGDWLGSLWDNFIADLLGVGATLLASVEDDLENLVEKLPFSIPWDIAALLALLVAEPVTPVVTIPWSTVGAGGTLVSSNIVVDLEPYEGAAALIRHMETLVFIGYLLFRFKDDLAVVGGIIDA